MIIEFTSEEAIRLGNALSRLQFDTGQKTLKDMKQRDGESWAIADIIETLQEKFFENEDWVEK